MRDRSLLNRIIKLFNIVLGLGVGATAGLISPVMKNIRNLTFGQYLAGLGLLLLQLYLAFFLQIIIHEGGHLVFGLLTGYGFSSFRILSFMLVRKNGKLTLRRFGLSGTAGQCLMSPPEMKDGKMPYVLYNLGGVLMNLIASAVCCIAAVLTAKAGKEPVFLWIMAMSGVYMALTNGIPFNDTVPNDGHNALNLGKDPVALRSFWVQLAVNAASTQGKRMKELPGEWFEIPAEADMSNNLITSWRVLAENRAMDLHDFPQARSLLDSLLDGGCELIEMHRALMLNDRAYLDILEKGKDADLSPLGGKTVAVILKQMRNYPSVLRTQYAEALIVKEDDKKADEILGSFEKISRTYPSEADIEAERELMDIARNRPVTAAEEN